LFWKDGICMTPTDTRKRDELAEAYGLAVNKHRQEHMPQTYITGEPRPWLDKPDYATTTAFKAGYDAALAECAGEIERLRAGLKECTQDCTSGLKHIVALREQCEKLKFHLSALAETVCAQDGLESGVDFEPNDTSAIGDAFGALEQFTAWEASQKGRAE
jgi:hypothetical protein